MTNSPNNSCTDVACYVSTSPLGKVETSKDISAEVQQIDVLLSRGANSPENNQYLGLLSKLITTSAIIEPFRNRATKSEIRSCIGKLLALIANFERQAHRDKTRLEEDSLPYL